MFSPKGCGTGSPKELGALPQNGRDCGTGGPKGGGTAGLGVPRGAGLAVPRVAGLCF